MHLYACSDTPANMQLKRRCVDVIVACVGDDVVHDEDEDDKVT